MLLALLASFVPRGRNLAVGGSVGARYFLLTLLLFYLRPRCGAPALELRERDLEELLRVRLGQARLRADCSAALDATTFSWR